MDDTADPKTAPVSKERTEKRHRRPAKNTLVERPTQSKTQKSKIIEKKTSVRDSAPNVTAIDLLLNIGSNNKYRAVKTGAALKKLITSVPKNLDVGVDTETSGLDRLACDMHGYSFSWKAGTAYWVPLSVDPKLKQLSKLLKKITAIFYNAGFDIAIVERFGAKVFKFEDAALACYFNDGIDYRQGASLKRQAGNRLDVVTVELKDLLRVKNDGNPVKDSDVDFLKLTKNEQRIYACQDADITLQMWKLKDIQNTVARMTEDDLWQLEHNIIRVVMEMELNGVTIDIGQCAVFDSILETECDKLAKKIHYKATRACKTKKVGGKSVFVNADLRRLTAKKGLNLGSSMQKQLLIYDKTCLHLPVTQKTDAGKPSCNRSTLEGIAYKHPIIPMLIEWTKWNHRRTAYTKVFPTKISIADGRLHSSFRQEGTISGRFSCSGPNLQGISLDAEEDSPVKIRDLFVAEKGELMIAADYDQMELRIATSLSGDEWLLNQYVTGEDIHTNMAIEIFGVKKPTPEQRKTAKICNFSILNGVGSQRLSRMIHKPVDHCQGIVDKWFSVVPQLQVWMNKVWDQAEQDEYIETYFGRVRELPDIRRPSQAAIAEKMKYILESGLYTDRSPNELEKIAKGTLRASGRRFALSHIVQGTAADLVKIALHNVYDATRKADMPLKMWAVVHDEICFRFKGNKRTVGKAMKLINDAMVFEIEDWVPLTVDINYGKTWGECK